jgi:pyrroloquinoline-quinone synthase
LREKYGAGEAACEYFTLHATADVYHSQVWHDHLERLITAHPDQEQPALDAAEKAAHALWRALDGIEARRHAPVAS